MKGFIITFDAVVALLFLLIALILLSTLTFQPLAPRGVYLKQITLDVLTVLEKDGRLSLALEDQAGAVREILQYTPELVCIQVSIIDEGGENIATISKSGCHSHGRELQTAARPFLHDGQNYMAKAHAWYRKEIT